MKTLLVPMAIGAGVVYASMVAATLGVGVIAAKVTTVILEKIDNKMKES